MINKKKKINQRKHCLFRDQELAIIQEAIAKAAATFPTGLFPQGSGSQLKFFIKGFRSRT
jgi:hypothetical protein